MAAGDVVPQMPLVMPCGRMICWQGRSVRIVRRTRF